MTAGAGWRGRLRIDYRVEGGRCIALDRHEGPLRVLQPLYPEGPAVCHHVVVHPPGGIVGGDELAIDATLAAGSHALLTTPGATRFYRSDGAAAQQRVLLRLATGARAEWLPLETIAHPGCNARSTLIAELQPGAQMIGWDVLALGLPAAGQAFDHGRFVQHIELPGVWLERGSVDGGDSLLLNAAPGWAGRSVLATAWFAAGSAWPAAQRDALLDAARSVAGAHPLAPTAGATAPQPQLVVLRVLAPRVEPAMDLLRQVRGAWRHAAWSLPPEPPRIWRT